MNILLLLTALLASLTGMISGERASAAGVQASARSIEQAPETVAARVAAVIVPAVRPSGVIHSRILPLPRAFALAPAAPLFAEKRRE